jgi:hypothetical protein
VVELKHSLILRMLQATSWWNEDTRLHAALMVVLIADADYELRDIIFKALKKGRYRVDAALVVTLYEASPKALRRFVVGADAFGYLNPEDFESRFLQTYRHRALTAAQRRDLTRTLETYLWRQPGRLKLFAPLILGLMRGSGWDRVRGLDMARRLSSLSGPDQNIVRESLRARMPEIKMNAHNLLFWWVKRKSELSPELRAFSMSQGIREIAYDRYKHDPDVDVQTCAYYFLKAREPRAGHKPPKGMPVPPPRRRRRPRA